MRRDLLLKMRFAKKTTLRHMARVVCMNEACQKLMFYPPQG